MIVLYGIPNCDTVKKTTTWLKNHQVAYHFHNYKTEGITASKLEEWLRQQPLEKVMNRASSTWKGLSEDQKAATSTMAGAIAAMIAQPSIIKRPVLEDQETGKVLAIGFKENEYATLLG